MYILNCKDAKLPEDTLVLLVQDKLEVPREDTGHARITKATIVFIIIASIPRYRHQRS